MIRGPSARQLSFILTPMPRLNLTDEGHTELVSALRGIIDTDRFPLSPRIRLLKAVLT
jgi:hypothetical protein